MTGKCRLCQRSGVELLDSHIMSKWAFRRAAGHDEHGARISPVRVANGTAILSSREIKEYLLCGHCEQLLGKDEDYVARLAYQPDGSLGLQKLSAARLLRNDLQVFPVGHLDHQAIVRFAFSVFWRAHESTRPECRSFRLEGTHAESLRIMLSTGGAFPADAGGLCLTGFVLMENGTGASGYQSMIIPPGTMCEGPITIYQFIVAGLVFDLLCGEAAAGFRPACLHCGTERDLLVVSPRDVKSLQNEVASIRDSVPKGKLARMHPKQR